MPNKGTLWKDNRNLCLQLQHPIQEMLKLCRRYMLINPYRPNLNGPATELLRHAESLQDNQAVNGVGQSRSNDKYRKSQAIRSRWMVGEKNLSSFSSVFEIFDIFDKSLFMN